MQGEQRFVPEPWYNPDGDCIVYQLVDEAIIAERIDELLTIYRSAIDRRPIGFQVKGVAAIIKSFGLAGMVVSSSIDKDKSELISVAALLLAAYERGPRTIKRRQAYASAMECPSEHRTIPASELQLA